MQFAYLATDDPIERVAIHVRDAALPGFLIEERYGLNVANGQYFLLTGNNIKIILCWAANYADPPAPRFTFALYARDGRDDCIMEAALKLRAFGVEVELGSMGEHWPT